MTNCIKHIRQWAVSLLALALAACTSEDFETSNDTLMLREGEVALQWVPAQLGVYRVSTSRATGDIKIPEETKINTVHIFIFGPDGKYLTGGGNAFQGYKFLDGSQNYVLSTELFANVKNAANATVYAIANMPKNQFGEVDEMNGIPANVPDEVALLKQVYRVDNSNFTVNIPDGGIPMFGTLEANLSPDATIRVLAINLKSMMARIDLDFQMIPDQESDDGRNPSLVFNTVMVDGFPMGGTLNKQITANDMNTDDAGHGITLTDLREVSVEGLTGRTFRKNEPLEGIHLYMFEHSRDHKTVEEAFAENGGKYPEGIDDPENSDSEGNSRELKQRYKNRFANEGAANIVLKGAYTNHNGHTYQVTYTIYPGASHIGEESGAFTIKSNFLYKNRITVTGITANNLGPEALLDTRVYIDETTNPYFIEMLRERRHDAHFNVTPMDIYKDFHSTVQVEIIDPKSHPWVRMEPMSVANNNDPSLYDIRTGNIYATVAGDGKRKYFTEGLLDELDGQPGSTNYTTASKNEEERIYFYLDENTEGIEQLPDRIPTREVQVRITYTSPNGEKETRLIPIRQSGMRKVYFDKLSDGGTHDMGRPAYSFYIEEYEEYLQHFDGKNEYKATLNGLKWGFEGITTGLGGEQGNNRNNWVENTWADNNWADYMGYGWYNTMEMMKKLRDNLQQDQEMTLNMQPRGAAEYCYNKNRRNSEGKVLNVHWYMPTISELEYAIEKHYTAFGVFQDQWYWSSNPGASGLTGSGRDEKWNTTAGENNEFARATRVKYDPQDKEQQNGYVHYHSESDYPYNRDEVPWQDKLPQSGTNNYYKGVGGYAKRSNVFRIRAAYIPNPPRGQNVPSTDNRQYYR